MPRRSPCFRRSGRWSAATGTTPRCRSTTSRTRAWSPPSSWPYQVNLLRADKKPIASTIPDEGATGWADTTMMHVDAKHPNCAYKWLEHSLSPKLQGDLAAWFGSVPAVPAACKGNALLDRYRLLDQRLRQFREDLVLAHADGQVRAGRHLRALLAMGEGLHRHPRQVIHPTADGRPFIGPAVAAMAQAPCRPPLGSSTPPAISARSAPSTASPSTSPKASSSPCSAPRARARPPACA